MDSILNTVKKALGGIDPSNMSFDEDLIIFINSVFSVLTQLGVGSEDGFVITGAEETWEDFLDYSNQQELEMVKGYITLKVKLMFDPPSNSFTQEAIKKVCDEYEWRMNVAVETPSSITTPES